jgi:succinyl-CoA synthetase alpha subunit
MSIWVNSETKVVVQGITGKEGRFHSEKCREYGTKIVAGVTPGKAGQDVDGVPVFNTVEDAVAETGANASLIFVPPPFAADAILEAADAGIEVVVCISEGIPARDMVRVQRILQGLPTRLIGGNCQASSRPANASSASCPVTSRFRARSASSRAPEPSPMRRSVSSPRSNSASRPVSASAAMRSRARIS